MAMEELRADKKAELERQGVLGGSERRRGPIGAWEARRGMTPGEASNDASPDGSTSFFSC